MKPKPKTTSDDVPLELEEQPKKEVYFLDIENDIIIIKNKDKLIFYFNSNKFNETNTKEILQLQHANLPKLNYNDNKIIVVAIIRNIDKKYYWNHRWFE